ncbi:ATP-binding SpoIIE family protein phosphatase [Streptomyces chiangmaiensis]|uniref:SpoIIE family protein phosphatase n=1 Tax=Streptomyces chiangmaiensis TaxID=766497 RepID=A0ABU7FU50_9ACTN|nr:SpoIIE family protein phosphatase [Streptomyces chiangmaiensis]MED7827425.1 SpoIIE family protein phosphatase [Streptomyces chiangmaiensis]
MRLSRSFAFLLLSVALFSGVQLALAVAHIHVMGLPEYSVLIPVVASALLPLRQTMIVGLFNLTAVIAIYGTLRQDIGYASQITVIMALAVALGISLAVCRVRIAGSRRLNRLMIARERLMLLSEASDRVGSTLNVARTAEELAEAAVHRFADHAAVDLFDCVLQGEEPSLGPRRGEITLRRTAWQSALAVPPGTARSGAAVTYCPGSVPALSLMTGAPMRVEITDTGDAACWPVDAVGTDTHAPHSALAVPLRARGATLGAALFTRSRGRDPFDADDVLLAQEIGARAAVCVDNARRYTSERNTSLALQRSLLPQVVPKHPAVEAATRYMPADSRAGVGGDWYDVIPLSGARVALVVGDVVGHGLHASATMGRLRAAVRTLADIDLPPDELLTHLDDLVIQRRMVRDHAQEGSRDVGADYGEVGATCLYMIYDPVSRRCTAARAGHPAPALVRPGSQAERMDIPAGPPLGVGGLPFETVELHLPEGSLLALYTDGLIESPVHSRDEGFKRLQKSLSQPMPSLEELCDHVLDAVDDDRSRDDAALVIARTQQLDSRHVATWDLSDDLAAVARARNLASLQLADWDLQESTFTTEVVVSELVTNAIRYGGGPVQLRLIRQDTLICEVSDGSNTAPHLRRARVFDEGGRGLFIVAQLAERWGTRQRFDGKTIWAELGLEA